MRLCTTTFVSSVANCPTASEICTSTVTYHYVYDDLLLLLVTCLRLAIIASCLVLTFWDLLSLRPLAVTTSTKWDEASEMLKLGDELDTVHVLVSSHRVTIVPRAIASPV